MADMSGVVIDTHDCNMRKVSSRLEVLSGIEFKDNIQDFCSCADGV